MHDEQNVGDAEMHKICTVFPKKKGEKESHVKTTEQILGRRGPGQTRNQSQDFSSEICTST
jgi:hypothetical protein